MVLTAKRPSRGASFSSSLKYLTDGESVGIRLTSRISCSVLTLDARLAHAPRSAMLDPCPLELAVSGRSLILFLPIPLRRWLSVVQRAAPVAHPPSSGRASTVSRSRIAVAHPSDQGFRGPGRLPCGSAVTNPAEPPHRRPPAGTWAWVWPLSGLLDRGKPRDSFLHPSAELVSPTRGSYPHRGS